MAGRSRTLTLKTQVEVKGLDKLDNLGKKMQKVGGVLTAGVTAPLALLGGVASKAASDLNESMNAINVSFGETADAIHAIGEVSAEEFGLSQRAFNDVAVRFSAFANTIAGEGGDVAKVVEDLTRRGSDFASVYNLEVNDALGLFQSGLAGETEPLRRFGIDLSAAAVEAHALSTGIADGTGALTEAQKVQARYSLLLEATSKVQGDFANTSGEVANQQRILAAETENAAAALGKKFLPIQQKLIEFANGLLDAWNKLPPSMQDLVVVFGAIAAAAGPVLLVFGSLLRSVKLIQGAVGKLPPGGLLARLFPLGVVATFAEPVDQALGKIRESIRDLLGLEDIQFQTPDWMRFELDPFSEFFLQVRPALKEMTDAQWDAVEESGNAWAAHNTAISDAMYGPGGAVPTILGATDEMAADMGELPGKMADELLANQQRLTDATSELVNFMEQALSPAQEMASLQGFLTSQELAQGLASNNPLVRQKATELREAAEGRLRELNGYQYGAAFAGTFALGISENQWKAQSAAAGMAQAISGIMPQSEPKDPNSPFRGITTWGGKMVTTITDGIYGSLGVAGNASKALAGALAPNLSTSSIGRIGVPGVNAAAPRGGDVHIHLTVMGDLRADERTLPGTLRRAAFASGMGS